MDETAIPNWRDGLKVHPAADLFPMMSAEELRALGEDIKQHGLNERITVLRPQDGETPCSLLDGRNRLDAMEAVGMMTVENGRVTVPTRYMDETPEFDPLAYVISANLHRRHLTTEQKREVIASVLKVQPERSDRAIGKLAQVDHKTVATVRSEIEGRGEIPHADARTDSLGRQQPAHKPEPKLDRDDAAQVRDARPLTMMQLSALLRIDTGKTLEEIVRALRDARREIEALPEEKRIATARGLLRALAVSDV